MLTCDETRHRDGPIAIKRLAQKAEHWPAEPVDQVQTCSKHDRANDGRPEIAARAPAEKLGKGGDLQRVTNGTILHDTGRGVLGGDEIFSRSGVFPSAQDIDGDERYPEECDETKDCKGH